MAPNTVKCANCNVVINEILSFIQNKVDVMDEEGIVRLCSSAFTSEEIENAKCLLFESITTTKRNVRRKKEGKSQRDLFDVIAVFKETDPDKVPIFVARDLHKLPAVTFDHLDVTRLLKELLTLQSDMKHIKDDYVTSKELDSVKNELCNLKQASIVNNFEGICNVNMKRGGSIRKSSNGANQGDDYLRDSICDSGPMGLRLDLPTTPDTDPPPFTECAHTQTPHLSLTACEANDSVLPTPQRVGEVCGGNLSGVPTLRPLLHLAAPEIKSNVNKQPRLLAQVVRDPGVWKNDPPKEEWILVQNKRLRNRFIGQKGNAVIDSDTKFKAAAIKVPIYINKVHKETTEADIKSYILRRTSVDVDLEKLNRKQDKDYNSYKIIIPKYKLDVFLDNSLWPEGVTFRRFIDFRERKPNKTNG